MTDSLPSMTDSNISVLMKVNDFNTLVYWKGKYDPFVVVLNFDDKKPDGQKWSSGSYFHTLEDALRYIKNTYCVDVYNV